MANDDHTPPRSPPRDATSIAMPLSARWTWIIYPIAILCVILRAPDRFFTPQLWAEDGRIFLLGSVQEGFGSLFDVYAGYLHLLVRIVAYPGRWLPLEWIPSYYHFGAIVLLLFGMWLIKNSRHDLPARHLMALCVPFVMFPGVTMLNLTNAQWFLAPALPFLLLQKSALTPRQTVQDAILILCLGLTGPFILLWLPLLALRPFIHSLRRSDLAIYGPAIISAVIQIILLLNNERREASDIPEPEVVLSLLDFLRVIVGHSSAFFFFGPFALYSPSILGVVGICIVAWLLWLIFHLSRTFYLTALGLIGAGAIVLLAGAFNSPSHDIATMWPGNAGERYYLPLFVFATQVLVLLACTSPSASFIAFRIVLAAVALSTIFTFRITPLPNLHWKENVDKATNIPGKSRLKILPAESWDIMAYPPSPKPARPLIAKDYVIKKSKKRTSEKSESPR